VDAQLRALIDLQVVDSRIAGLEAQVAQIPAQIAAIHAAVDEARKAMDGLKARVDVSRKSQRAREKDLEDNRVKRQKYEGQLYQVKTNKEYSAVLAEIEGIKVEKGRIEEEILGHMDAEERLAREIAEAEKRLARQTEEFKAQEAAAMEEQRALEADLAVVKAERDSQARDIPRDLLTQYTRLLRGRGGLAVAVVGSNGICTGCRLSLTPQRFNELRQSSQILTCEGCGRILYYQP
jgi:uncharacterized protein